MYWFDPSFRLDGCGDLPQQGARVCEVVKTLKSIDAMPSLESSSCNESCKVREPRDLRAFSKNVFDEPIAFASIRSLLSRRFSFLAHLPRAFTEHTLNDPPRSRCATAKVLCS